MMALTLTQPLASPAVTQSDIDSWTLALMIGLTTPGCSCVAIEGTKKPKTTKAGTL